MPRPGRVGGKRVNADHQFLWLYPRFLKKTVGEVALLARKPCFQMIISHRNSIRSQQIKKVLHLMLVVTIRHARGQQKTPPLGGKADSFSCTREKRHQGTTEGAFQHIDLVEPAGSKVADKSQLIAKRLVRSPAVGVNGHRVPEKQFIHIGDPLYDIR